MSVLERTSDGFRLSLEGRPLIAHSASAPFVFAGISDAAAAAAGR